MSYRILQFLLLLLAKVLSQTTNEVLKSIDALTQEAKDYQYPKNYNEFKYSSFINAGSHGTYDFIIIGAGSAGTLLANRLSGVPEWKILLLEAGGDDNLVTDIPSMAGLLQFSKYNWGYKTVPQKNCCLGMINKQCNMARGKGLGGSSTINYMMYIRGNKADFDKLSSDGNPGWFYKEVLPYFIKMENSSLTENVDQNYHGHNGTLSVEHTINFGGLGQAFLDAEVELGRNILDYNGKDQLGFSKFQYNTIKGRRCSGNKAFLKPASKRKNLTIVKGAFVTRIFTENGSVASDVQFLVKDKKYHAKTTKEIILSAGSIGSPQILLHSGVGPKEDFKALGINVVADLPVGKNLHDHPTLIFPLATNFTDTNFKPMNEMVSEYLKGFKYLTTPGDIQSVGFINTKNSILPNTEQFIDNRFDLINYGIPKLFNYDELTKAYVKPYGTSSALYFQLLPHGKSRGTLKLKSKNIFDHPLIDLNFFDDLDDIKTMIEGIRDFEKVLNTTAMQKFNSRYLYNPIPQCHQKFMSDDYLECLLRHLASSLYHIAGTCKMGPASDPNAVVDHTLKVKGFRNLRVVDASVMPFPIAAHMNAPTYMIAEKASDMIKKRWKYNIFKTDSHPKYY